jgi:hypothetical protein
MSKDYDEELWLKSLDLRASRKQGGFHRGLHASRKLSLQPTVPDWSPTHSFLRPGVVTKNNALWIHAGMALGRHPSLNKLWTSGANETRIKTDLSIEESLL